MILDINQDIDNEPWYWQWTGIVTMKQDILTMHHYTENESGYMPEINLRYWKWSWILIITRICFKWTKILTMNFDTDNELGYLQLNQDTEKAQTIKSCIWWGKGTGKHNISLYSRFGFGWQIDLVLTCSFCLQLFLV